MLLWGICLAIFFRVPIWKRVWWPRLVCMACPCGLRWAMFGAYQSSCPVSPSSAKQCTIGALDGSGSPRFCQASTCYIVRWHRDRETERQTDRQADRQRKRQTSGLRQTDRQTDRQAGKQIDRQREREREMATSALPVLADIHHLLIRAKSQVRLPGYPMPRIFVTPLRFPNQWEPSKQLHGFKWSEKES